MAHLPTNEFYKFEGKEKTLSLGLIVGGVILTVLGVVFSGFDMTHFMTSLLYNNLFFLMLGLVAAFFIASQTMGYNGWFILVKRLPESMMMWTIPAALIMGVILFFGHKSIFHWFEPSLTDPTSSHFDAILASKSWWLNSTFWWARTIAYLLLWAGLVWLMRRNAAAFDNDASLDPYKSSMKIAGIFLFVFAVSSSTMSWDWLMSIQPHWYSTLFGWYCFISMFVTTMAVIILMVHHLQAKGYLKYVNKNHFHDLGKLTFAFSVAWAYLFFSQFMLIWYANIPEETMYYNIRITHMPLVMWLCVILNFVVPFFLLITERAKKIKGVTTIACCLIIFGHWLDFYQMSVPGAIFNMGSFHSVQEATVIPSFPGLMEMGMGLTFGGLFLFVTFTYLTRLSLVPVNHPFVKESMTYHA